MQGSLFNEHKDLNSIINVEIFPFEQAETIHYAFYQHPFGKCLVASTALGICAISFYEKEEEALKELEGRYPHSTFLQQEKKIHTEALKLLDSTEEKSKKLPLHIRFTSFQFAVWEELLKIPFGGTSTYGEIAQKIEKPKASRAVGTAIGSNPVAILIPCHRVIQNSGKLGGYRWGLALKRKLLNWEAEKESNPEI